MPHDNDVAPKPKNQSNKANNKTSTNKQYNYARDNNRNNSNKNNQSSSDPQSNGEQQELTLRPREHVPEGGTLANKRNISTTTATCCIVTKNPSSNSSSIINQRYKDTKANKNSKNYNKKIDNIHDITTTRRTSKHYYKHPQKPLIETNFEITPKIKNNTPNGISSPSLCETTNNTEIINNNNIDNNNNNHNTHDRIETNLILSSSPACQETLSNNSPSLQISIQTSDYQQQIIKNKKLSHQEPTNWPRDSQLEHILNQASLYRALSSLTPPNLSSRSGSPESDQGASGDSSQCDFLPSETGSALESFESSEFADDDDYHNSYLDCQSTSVSGNHIFENHHHQQESLICDLERSSEFHVGNNKDITSAYNNNNTDKVRTSDLNNNQKNTSSPRARGKSMKCCQKIAQASLPSLSALQYLPGQIQGPSSQIHLVGAPSSRGRRKQSTTTKCNSNYRRHHNNDMFNSINHDNDPNPKNHYRHGSLINESKQYNNKNRNYITTANQSRHKSLKKTNITSTTTSSKTTSPDSIASSKSFSPSSQLQMDRLISSPLPRASTSSRNGSRASNRIEQPMSQSPASSSANSLLTSDERGHVVTRKPTTRDYQQEKQKQQNGKATMKTHNDNNLVGRDRSKTSPEVLLNRVEYLSPSSSKENVYYHSNSLNDLNPNMRNHYYDPLDDSMSLMSSYSTGSSPEFRHGRSPSLNGNKSPRLCHSPISFQSPQAPPGSRIEDGVQRNSIESFEKHIRSFKDTQLESQKQLFTTWINHFSPNLIEHDLIEELRDGVKLVGLVANLVDQDQPDGSNDKKKLLDHYERAKQQELKHKQEPPYESRAGLFNSVCSKHRHLSNVSLAVDYLREKRNMKIINLNLMDIVSGKPNVILGLCWSIILEFQQDLSRVPGALQKQTELLGDYAPIDNHQYSHITPPPSDESPEPCDSNVIPINDPEVEEVVLQQAHLEQHKYMDSLDLLPTRDVSIPQVEVSYDDDQKPPSFDLVTRQEEEQQESSAPETSSLSDADDELEVVETATEETTEELAPLNLLTQTLNDDDDQVEEPTITSSFSTRLVNICKSVGGALMKTMPLNIFLLLFVAGMFMVPMLQRDACCELSAKNYITSSHISFREKPT